MSLKIIKAGMLDTIQDTGRYGFQHEGINPGGAMDRFSASLANALLGKKLNAPVIETHFPAAKILFQKKAIICLAGADFTAAINELEISIGQPVAVKANSILSFKKQRSGARCYLAVSNGLEIESWLNSYGTNLKAKVGGYDGRRLERDDEINFAGIDFETNKDIIQLPWRYNEVSKPSNAIEFIFGPEWNWLSTKGQTDFVNNAFLITPFSDRMGYRLQGEALEQTKKEQLVSSAVNFGTVQLLPDGGLIVLMADHQTTGGYPRIANVIGVHLPKLAQMKAGSEVKFVMTTLEEAEEKWVLQQTYLQGLQSSCHSKMQNWLHAHRR